MTKTEIIELLKIRGVTSLKKGQTAGMALKESGGPATEEEINKVNEKCYEIYLIKYMESKRKGKEMEENIKMLVSEVERLTSMLEDIYERLKNIDPEIKKQIQDES